MDDASQTDAPGYADPQRYIELARFRGTWRDLWYNRDYLDLLARRFRLAEVSRALDVGCGAGHWGRRLLPLMAEGARLCGVDREEAFLSLAREQAPAGRCEYVVGEAEELPFADDSFDLVTCQTLLIHVADPARVIAEMARVTRPGGLVLAAEPDNRAGNLALLGGEPRPADDDTLAIVELLLVCDRGKLALGEGDQSIGGRLPGLLAAGRLGEVMAYNNDRCMTLIPPYARGDMQLVIETEREWYADDISLLCGAREDNWRFFRAGGGSREAFDRAWAAVRRWMALVQEGVAAGRYHAGRAFVMYLVGGRVPESPDEGS